MGLLHVSLLSFILHSDSFFSQVYTKCSQSRHSVWIFMPKHLHFWGMYCLKITLPLKSIVTYPVKSE
jgi:hypothetical protein